MEVIDPIPFELDVEDLLETLTNRRIREKDIIPLIDECRRLIEPKAVYKSLQVTKINGDEIQIEGGYSIKSVILGDSLEDNQTVVPYVVTIGPQLEAQASKEAKENILRGFIMEQIADYAVSKARAYLESLTKKSLGGSVYNFSPGAGTGKLFEIDQQEVIFQILNSGHAIGVNLTPNYLMLPRKSISGILAATSQEYMACQYCPRDCERRRAPYSGEYIGHHCEYDVR